MRRIIWYATVVMGTLTLLVIIWQLRQALVLFLFSLVVASAINPLIDNFLEHNLPRWAALALSYILLSVLIAFILIAVTGPLLHDLQAASNDLSLGYENIREQWLQSDEFFLEGLAEQMPSSSDLYEGFSGGQRAEMIQAVVGFTGGIATFLGNLGIIIVLSIYWSVDRIHFERLWLSMIPVSGRIRARGSWRAIENGIGSYVRSELIQALLAGLFLWIGFYFMQLKYPMFLAVFAALAWLIPWLGGVIALIPPLLVGLGQSVPLGFIAAGYVLLVLILLEYVVEPRFFHRQRYSSVLLLIIVLIFADAFGLLGIILAPLVAAAIEITLSHVFRPYIGSLTQEKESSKAWQQLSHLRDRLSQVNKIYQERQGNAMPEVHNLIARLEKLVIKVENYTITELPSMDGIQSGHQGDPVS